MSKVNEGPIYVVTWGDAWGGEGVYYASGNDYTPMLMKDIGWVCEETAETIVLCKSISETGRRRDIVVIPWCNVVRMEELV